MGALDPSVSWYAGAAWHITRHALDRWAERYAPDAPPEESARLLGRLSSEAIDTGVTTRDGRALYLHPEHPHCRFVVAARAPGETRPTLLTIVDAPELRVRRDSGTRRGRRRG